MKKLFTLIAIVYLFPAALLAQNSYLIVESGIAEPFSAFGNTHKNGFSSALSFAVNPHYESRGFNYFLTASVGYQRFESNDDPNYVSHIVPITLGAIFPFGQDWFVPYLKGEVGAYIGEYDNGFEKVNETSFGFAPGVGFFFALNRFWGLDVQAKFTKVLKKNDEIGYFGYHGGLVFRF
ncbi:MAG: hypothetical protein IPJ03_04445 [Ignavibacteriales bacterium]|nr:hypothetical protein [Ignavibacteriales bacterium]